MQEIKFHVRQLAFDLLNIPKSGNQPCRFLGVVVNNALCDVVRKTSIHSRREIPTLVEGLPERSLADDTGDPCQQAIRIERAPIEQELLLSLDEADRCLVMHHYGFLGAAEGYAAIAERLGIEEESAKKRGYRAILTLRKCMRSQFGEFFCMGRA